MATPTCLSSGLLTEDTQLTEGRNLLHGAKALEDGEVRIFDGEDNTGKLLLVVGTDPTIVFSERPIRVTEGIFVEITGAGAEAIVYFG